MHLSMIKRSLQKQHEISQREVEDFFKRMERSRDFTPLPAPERDSMADWITTNNSSDGDGNLIRVAAWQIGKKS